MTLISPNSTHPRRLTCGPFPAARPGAGYRGGTGRTCGAVRRYRHTPTGPIVTQTLGLGGGVLGVVGLGEGTGEAVGEGAGGAWAVGPGPGARRWCSSATRGVPW